MKLHLGCGNRRIDGFIHIDLMDYEYIDYKSSADKLGFIKDGTVDLIYASHLLEHFGRNEIEKVLTEWHRVLKRGGILRLAVPNFEAIVNVYMKNKNLEELLGLLIGGQKNEYDFHKMIFDERLLKRSLLKAGFSKAYRYDWRKTEHCNIDDFSQAYLPHMDKEKGILMSLNLEAVK
ncbi:MAG: methyltransferase domain-containing protein [Deltaproteobacteria bacterium]|nr:methyltransferase domain-containing protein [Deltaproteobacteria bacterium]